MTNLTRYDVFNDLFGDLAKGFMVRPFALDSQPELQIRVDVSEDDKAYTVHADIPGVRKEDIHVDVEGNEVSISAEAKKESEKKENGRLLRRERYEGMVSRSFQLPHEVDSGGAQAKYKDGVLELTLPKKAGGKAAQLKIQ